MWVVVVCSSPGLVGISDLVGNFQKILGLIGKFWEILLGNLGFLDHQTASIAGAPITT